MVVKYDRLLQLETTLPCISMNILPVYHRTSSSNNITGRIGQNGLRPPHVELMEEICVSCQEVNYVSSYSPQASHQLKILFEPAAHDLPVTAATATKLAFANCYSDVNAARGEDLTDYCDGRSDGRTPSY